MSSHNQNVATAAYNTGRRYSFLSKPPAQAKSTKRPHPIHPVNVHLPLPTTPSPSSAEESLLKHHHGGSSSRRRSSTFTSITNTSVNNWASSVQPGSPAPMSPHYSHHYRQRRSSVQAQPQYANVGYNHHSTPYSPIPPAPATAALVPEGGSKHKRAPSLRALNPMASRKRTKSVSAKPSKPTRKDLPPSLESELLLMQFADGGSIDSHARRVMEARAAQAAPAGSRHRHGQSHGAGVGQVFRDENGNTWWDEDEKLEYTKLLDRKAVVPVQPGWEGFTGDESFERKDSAGSIPDPRSLIREANTQDLLVDAVPRPSMHARSNSELGAFDHHVRTERRRPAPLDLGIDVERARKSFLDNSFNPAPIPQAPPMPTSARVLRKKTSRMNVKALFGKH